MFPSHIMQSKNQLFATHWPPELTSKAPRLFPASLYTRVSLLILQLPAKISGPHLFRSTLPRLPVCVHSSTTHRCVIWWALNRVAHLYLSFVCEGRSRLEYCLERAERSPSPFPRPPLAGSNVGLAAVVIPQKHALSFREPKMLRCRDHAH